MKTGIKILFLVMAITMIATPAVMAGGSREAAAKGPQTLRMGMMETDKSAAGLAAARFAELAAK